MSSEIPKWTERQLTIMLRHRYEADRHAFAAQVPNATGMAKSRTCDGLAMGLWPSKGLYLTGHEIKVSRSDWLSEIQDLTKSRAFQRHCHYWYIVAPRGIVKLEEMPADWGLMCPTNHGTLRTKKAATLREPEPPSYNLLAGIFRAVLKNSVSEDEIKEARLEGYRRGQKDAEKRSLDFQKMKLTRLEKELERKEQMIKRFQEQTGLELMEFNYPELAKMINSLKGLSINQIVGNAAKTRRILQAALQKVQESEAMLQELAEVGDSVPIGVVE